MANVFINTAEYAKLVLKDGTRADKLKPDELFRRLHKLKLPVNASMGRQDLLRTFLGAVNDTAKAGIEAAKQRAETEAAEKGVPVKWRQPHCISAPHFNAALAQITGAAA